MKLKNKILVLSLFLVLICCLGAVSAADNNQSTISESLNDFDESIDEVDVASIENNDIQNQNGITEQVTEPNRATQVNASNWLQLKNACENTADQEITLTGSSYSIGNAINFKNSATIIGTDNSYITGGTTSKTPFKNTNSALTLHFINVKFLNVNANNLLELDGTVYLENCTFNNIQTATGHNSVIYNTNNLMYITGCNITNCNTGYGAVSNYNSGSTTSVVMYVDDCKFENNNAAAEPGAINNCGILYVNNSEFIGNHANLWAGAIHTHSNAQTEIYNSIFRRNTAGWNGGALYTYSLLKICNCTFEDNNCTTNNGGGAIGGYNYGSSYNITICSSRFNYNTNLCYAYTNISTTSVGRGGAISVLNGGYLTVYNSNFTGNYAKIGQAIAAATYTYENGTGGNPHIKIYNNRFVNHTATGIDTVVITGNDYLFNNNVFINSYQNTQYSGNGNTYTAAILTQNKHLMFKSEPKLGSCNSDVLSDMDNHDVIFVNQSSTNDAWADEIKGQNWTDAFGGSDALYIAVNVINDKGIIYIADGLYTLESYGGLELLSEYAMTLIGQGKDTIISNMKSDVYGCGSPDNRHCFINLTFGQLNICRGSDFINCNFISSILITEDFINYEPRHIEEYGLSQTYLMNFDNCVFKDVTTDNALVTLYKYGAVNFNNCTFENITADSLVYHNDSSYFDDDSISFKNCTFTNCKFNGVVDSAANFDDAIVIEDCNYDGEVAVGTTEVNGHFYVNATKLKFVAVKTNITVNSGENSVIITLKDVDGNPIANADVIYTIGTTNATATTIADGTATIPNLKGIVNITVNYLGNDSYLPSSNSGNFVFKYATTISAAVSGSDVVITLKDDENKALANTNVTYTINGAETTKATDANGTITLSGLKGVIAVTAKYAGDDLHTESNTTADYTFKYDTTLTAPKVSATYNVAKNLVITLKDENGKAIEGRYVTVKVGTISKNIKTDKNGQVSVNVAILTPKTYTASISFAGDTLYNAKSIKANVVVAKATPKLTAKKATFKVKKTKKYSVTLKDNKGKAINKVKVTIKVNGKTYSATTKNGKATFKLTKLTKKGTYKATIKFAGNSLYKAVTKKSVKIVVKK